jgi:hypothetical protein
MQPAWFPLFSKADGDQRCAARARIVAFVAMATTISDAQSDLTPWIVRQIRRAPAANAMLRCWAINDASDRDQRSLLSAGLWLVEV